MKQENQYLLAAGLILAFSYAAFWGRDIEEMYDYPWGDDVYQREEAEYQRKEKVLAVERSAEQKALVETQIIICGNF